MKHFLFLICCLLLSVVAAYACFGPKLYLGIKPGPEGELQYALVSIYVKEKTGTEVEKVILAADESPRDAIKDEKVDFAFVEDIADDQPLLTLIDSTGLLGGQRLRTDIQFTTTIPALSKLDKLSLKGHYPDLLEKVRSGAAPLSLARTFFFDRGWI